MIRPGSRVEVKEGRMAGQTGTVYKMKKDDAGLDIAVVYWDVPMVFGSRPWSDEYKPEELEEI